jgi:hypothetical protein
MWPLGLLFFYLAFHNQQFQSKLGQIILEKREFEIVQIKGQVVIKEEITTNMQK